MKKAILNLLQNIEAERGIEILYACESGSRAWGFASPDSDYDIRFLYRRPIQDSYLINSPSDTIEIPIKHDLDPGGWELRKALGLLAKSNGALIEWLHSPIIYHQNAAFLSDLRILARENLCPRNLANHYRGMAHRTMEMKMKVDKPTGKAYLYALRAVCSMQHACEKQTPPPVQFQDFLPVLADNLRAEVEGLLKWKKSFGEKDSPGRLTVIDSFLNESLQTMGVKIDAMPQRNVPHDDFNQTLHRWTLWPT